MNSIKAHNGARGRIYWGLVAGMLLVGCGSAGVGTDGSTDATSTASNDAAGAVALLFNAGVSGNLAKLKVAESGSESQSDGGNGSTCEEALRGSDNSEHPITVGAVGTPARYGSTETAVTIAEEDFCALSSSPTALNTAAGFDGSGLVATFTIDGDISTSCTGDTTIVMQAGSKGVWRNTSDYSPQVWGTFNFLVNGEPLTLDCTLYLGADETIVFADCSDENGTVVSQDRSASCQVQ